MENIKLFRRRFIPDETVYLKDDIVLYADDEIIVTEWKALRPRPDFYGGVSVAFIKDGYKVSRMVDSEGNTKFHYCDIIETKYDGILNSYTFTDLLADVKIYNDGRIEVMDLDELADAYREGLITSDQLDNALRQLDSLLKLIYKNGIESFFTGKGFSDV